MSSFYTSTSMEDAVMEDELDALVIESTPLPPQANQHNHRPAARTTTTTPLAATPPQRNKALPKGVCRIEIARVSWVITQPWQRTAQTKSSGTGFCIAGQRLLTNAHVVRSAVDIRVRPHGSTRRFPAHVVVYAPDVDLALLEICAEEKNEFYKHAWSSAHTSSTRCTSNLGDPESSDKKQRLDNNNDHDSNGDDSMALQFAEDLPALQESVHVVGYPTGGRTICVTEGVVSRIDLVGVSGWSSMLCIQIDASINSGNSGGPAFNAAGKVTGVAFMKNTKKDADNIGYVIPASVVRTFLGRCGNDGTYTLAPSIPYLWHPLENKSLRLAHKVPTDVHGVLLTRVSNTLEGSLRKGDVLTKVDDKPVADDGQVILRRDELIQHSYMLVGKGVDEPTRFSVYRDGEHIDCPSRVLGDIPSICMRWPHVDYEPDYLILGTLVLLPLSWSLRMHKRCGTGLIADTMDWCRRWQNEWEGKKGLVILTDIMAHELSFSYSRPWRRVIAYNGIPVLSLEHLRDLWEESCATATEDPPMFARIELDDEDDIVFEVKAAIKAQKEILETHQIPKPWHITPPNPKYK